jgi:hypothetical protein
MDPGPLKRPLEHASRGDLGRLVGQEQGEANPARPPAGMVALEAAGGLKDRFGGCRRGLSAGPVSDRQAVLALIAISTPDGADGVVGEAQFGGDLSQVLAIKMTSDDVMTCFSSDGTRHGMDSRRRC